MIMSIAIQTVKLKIKCPVQFHKMADRCLELTAEGLDVNSFIERQISKRLKNSFISLANQPHLSLNYNINLSNGTIVSADNMMDKAGGKSGTTTGRQRGRTEKPEGCVKRGLPG